MTTTLAILAALVSAAALAVSIWTAIINRRSANAADDSAISARLSADAARESARHAETSADSATVVARSETERDHRDLRPPHPDAATMIRSKKNPRTKETNRFLVFTPAHTYRAAGDAIVGDSRSPLSVGPVIKAGKEVEIYLDNGANGAQVEGIHMRFWPPVADDTAEALNCPCGRNVDSSGAAHWEWSITIPQAQKRTVTVL